MGHIRFETFEETLSGSFQNTLGIGGLEFTGEDRYGGIYVINIDKGLKIWYPGEA